MKIELPELKATPWDIKAGVLISVKIGDVIFVVNGQSVKPKGRPPSRMQKIKQWFIDDDIDKFTKDMVMDHFVNLRYRHDDFDTIMSKMIDDNVIMQMGKEEFKVVGNGIKENNEGDS